MAVARLQLHFTFKIRQANGAIPGMQIDSPLPRHVDLDINPVAVDVERNDVNIVREMDFQSTESPD